MHYHGHRKRLRSRLKNAPEQLQDYEVLELLLGYVLLRADTKPMAKEMLVRFSSLRGVMQAGEQELLEVPGLGPGVADFFFLLQEFFARHTESGPRRREELTTPEAVAAMARERLGKLAHEEMWVAYINNSNKLVAWEKLSKGSIDGATVNPRDILERALKLKAAGFILVHNHPGPRLHQTPGPGRAYPLYTLCGPHHRHRRCLLQHAERRFYLRKRRFIQFGPHCVSTPPGPSSPVPHKRCPTPRAQRAWYSARKRRWA